MKIDNIPILLGLFILILVSCSFSRSNRLTAVLTPQPTTSLEDEVVGDEKPLSATNSSGSTADIAAPPPTGLNLQPQLEGVDIPLNEIVTLLPPDAIPAILPEEVPVIFVSASKANELGMDPEERVIGLTINGESHAYPLPFMSRHEIVNDEVGGKLIAATW